MKITRRILVPEMEPKKIGLGDAAASVAKPVAGILDLVFKTDLAHCLTCEERREAWNRKLPDIMRLLA